MIDVEQLNGQMQRSRFKGGRFERFENGEWVPWPVLGLDQLGRREALRVATHDGRRRREERP